MLSDDEVRAIWRASLRYGGPDGRVVRLLLLTAQRREKVASMRWSKVSFKERTWDAHL